MEKRKKVRQTRQSENEGVSCYAPAPEEHGF